MALPVAKIAFDPNLLGTGWEAASFAAHRAMLLGIFGGKMTNHQRAMYAQMTGGLEPRTKPPRTLVIIKSRRVAGTRIAVNVSGALALGQYAKAPGEVPTVKYAASDRAQAAVAFSYATGSFAASPMLKREVVRTTQHRIELTNGHALEVSTADDAAVRGFTPIAWVVDEACYVANLDRLLAAIRPGLVTIPGSMLILISTPAGADGPVYDYDKRYFGKHDDDVLVIHAHYSLFNPNITEAFVANERLLDPLRAPGEWDLVFIVGMDSFLDRLLVESNTRDGARELPRASHLPNGTPIVYQGGIDISGGRGDHTAAAVVHRDANRIIVDAVRHWRSPHDADRVAKELAEFLRSYGLTAAPADDYGAGLAVSVYRPHGLTLQPKVGTQSANLLRILPLLTASRLELPPHPTLITELLGLERITRTGIDRVQGRGVGHDDLAAALAMAVVAATAGPTVDTAQQIAMCADFVADNESVFAHGANPRYTS